MYETTKRTGHHDGYDTHSRRHASQAQRRKLRIYSESLTRINDEYASQTLRLIELDVAAITNMGMIDRFMQRLGQSGANESGWRV